MGWQADAVRLCMNWWLSLPLEWFIGGHSPAPRSEEAADGVSELSFPCMPYMFVN